MKRKLLVFLLLCGTIARPQQSSYVITTVAGTDRVRDNGPAISAFLREPGAVITDSAGNVYIADQQDNRVRKVTTDGTITTFAGSGTGSGDSGPATGARLNLPTALALDAQGNLYIADFGNSKIRKVTPAGLISTVAGNGSSKYSGDNGPATSAGLDAASVAVDSAGNLYISDGPNYRIRRVTPSGTITTYAGTGSNGQSGDGGPATGAMIGLAFGLTVDSAGNLYFIDDYVTNTSARKVVRRITPSGTISTVAGNGNTAFSGDGGLAINTGIDPEGLTVDSGGNLYIADGTNARVRKVTISTGIITTVAGTGTVGFYGDGGPALQAQFAFVVNVSVDAQGNLYVVDGWNDRIRKINTAGVVTTIAGTDVKDGGPATSAFLNRPTGVAYDPVQGLFIGDGFNHRLRRVGSTGNISTAAGNGYLTTTHSDVPGNQTSVGFVEGMSFDTSGSLYFADADYGLLWRLGTGGAASFIAGAGNRVANNIPTSSVYLADPQGVAVDKSGNLFFSDVGYGFIYKSTNGTVTIYAGNNTLSYSGDGGPATSAGMDAEDLAIDTAGNLYVADFSNNRVRKITPAGIISTLAGNGVAGFGGDGGAATAAQLNGPEGVAVDSAGNVYIADLFNGRIRRVDATTGKISTVAGNGSLVYSGDGGPASQAGFTPYRIALAPDGSIYIADTLNDRIRKLTPQTATQFALTGGNNQTGAASSQLAKPLVVTVTSSTGTPVAGVPVTFAVTSGSATLSPTAAVTGTDGTASTVVTFGSTAGPVVVTATVSGLAPITFNLTSTAPVSSTSPTIAPGGVVGAALSTPAVQAISTGGIATVFGANFLPAGTNRSVTPADLVNGQLPTNLGGICVLVGGQRAPIFGIYSGAGQDQINFQVPAVTPGQAAVQVVTGCDTSAEVRSTPVTITAQAATPEFFYFRANAGGTNPIAAANAVTYALIGDPTVLGAGFTPAKPGDYISLYGTGFGATSPNVAPGQLPGGAAPIVGTVSVTIGGIPVTGANLLYVGLSPGYAGLYSVTLRVPDNVPAGNQPVVINVGGSSSPLTGFITIQQ